MKIIGIRSLCKELNQGAQAVLKKFYSFMKLYIKELPIKYQVIGSELEGSEEGKAIAKLLGQQKPSLEALQQISIDVNNLLETMGVPKLPADKLDKLVSAAYYQ